MKVLHLLSKGDLGGIERMCLNIGLESDWDNSFCFFHGKGKIYDEMSRNGFNVVDLSFFSTIKKIIYIYKLSKSYDIIVSHNEDPYIRFVQFILAFICKCKTVSFIHSCFYKESFYPKSFIKRLFCRLIFQLNFLYVDSIISVAKAGLNSYSTYFFLNQNKCFVLYNGIGKDKISKGLSNQLRTNIKTFKLLYVGRLSFHKRVDLLINAVSLLKDKYPLSLTIVGEGDEMPILRNQASLMNLNEIVSFEGSHLTVDDFFSNSDIFVYPSEQEIFGISLVEAMSFGLPCIANAVGGIPEFMNKKNGFLCNDISSESLANCIEDTIKMYKEKTINYISENSKNTARMFSMNNNLKGMKRLFLDLIN